MVAIVRMMLEDAYKIRDIDRSETIERVYLCRDGVLEERAAGHECPSWGEDLVREMIIRYEDEIAHGGTAFGAFAGDKLVGFAVLAHRFRGSANDQLQVDLMYVSRDYRRQGIGRRLMEALSEVAVAKGAKALYISSTETESAVKFYSSCGAGLAPEIDKELFEKEPCDIHMLLWLR